MIKLYTDGAFNPSTKKAAVGILIVNNGQQLQLGQSLTSNNNHSAEFAAATLGFQKLLENGLQKEPVLFYCDSQLVIDSMEKRYAKHYQDQVDELLKLYDQFDLVVLEWVSDKQNHGAHELAWQHLNN